MKNKQTVIILVYLVLLICPYSFAQDILDNNANNELEEEWARILEQAEKYRTEQQAKIKTLGDLECTYWMPINRTDKRIIPWNFAFLNENFVLVLDSYDPDRIFPRFLVRYSIRDDVIFFTGSMIGYLDNTYLFIGSEGLGFVKFELNLAFNFFEFDIP
jgi:hypothetical protein